MKPTTLAITLLIAALAAPQLLAQTGPGGNTGVAVDLTAFDVRYDGRHTYLDWRTASEVENAGFIISRSEGDTTEFEMIASHLTDPALQGQGTTSDGHGYRYTDAGYLEPGTTYYYRLQDVRLDGTIGKHPRTTAVAVPALTLPPATAGGYKLGQNIPNPARSLTRIPFAAPSAEQVRLVIYDDKGIELASYQVEVAEGMNTIDINVSTLSAGNYLYQIKAGKTILSRVMTVVR